MQNGLDGVTSVHVQKHVAKEIRFEPGLVNIMRLDQNARERLLKLRFVS
jgi:hypothetical protein